MSAAVEGGKGVLGSRKGTCRPLHPMRLGFERM